MADHVTIPAALRDEVAADLAAGGDRAERWWPDTAADVLILAADNPHAAGMVTKSRLTPGTAASLTEIITAATFDWANAWAPVGGVDGGPRPDIGDRVLIRESPDGGTGQVGTVGMIDNITGRVGVDLAGGESALATEWALLPQLTPGEASRWDRPHDDVAAILHRLEHPAPAAPVDPLTVDPDQAWPCADWCCSKGCPGIGNALCGRPPCDGRRCTCGHDAIRAVAHDRQRLARILADLTAWLTAERDRLRSAAMNTTSVDGNLDLARSAAMRRVLDRLRGQGLDVDYLAQPPAAKETPDA